MDSDASLNILIKAIADTTGFTVTKEQAAALNAELGRGSEATKDLGKKTEELSQSTEELGKAHEHVGEQAVSSRIKHLALHHAFEELNRLVPGLGTALMILERGLDRVGATSVSAASATKTLAEGEAAAGAAAAVATPEVAGFGAAVEAALVPLLPFIAVMLALQEAMNLWDGYKEKTAEAAQAAQENFKTIADAARGAREEQEKLQDALHPKPEAVSALEKDLARRQQATTLAFDSQREKDAAQRALESGRETTPEGRAAVGEKFREQAEQLEKQRREREQGDLQVEITAAEREINDKKSAADELTRRGAAKAKLAADPDASPEQTASLQKSSKDMEDKAAGLLKTAAELAAYQTKLQDQLDSLKTQDSSKTATAADVDVTTRQAVSEAAERLRLDNLRKLEGQRDKFLNRPDKTGNDLSEELSVIAQTISLINQLNPVDQKTHAKELSDLKNELAQLRKMVATHSTSSAG